MTEHEAIATALAYLGEHQLQHEGVKRAFFVPATASEDVLPGLKDRWIVHFKPRLLRDDEFDRFLSNDDVVIVAIDAETGVASITTQL